MKTKNAEILLECPLEGAMKEISVFPRKFVEDAEMKTQKLKQIYL